ncbi:MAG: sugar ABC transporter ATP-binding protein, partial [Sphaerochaetaceae bacterium]
LLEMRNISKDFFGNQVLHDISFTLGKGEILGLVGENGAGKSTLMKILFGMDEIRETGGYGGEVLIDGDVVHFSSSLDALNLGIGMVHQEFSLLPDFTAAENILLNREPAKSSFLTNLFGDRLDTIDRPKLEEISEKAIKRLGVPLDENMLVSQMPVGHKQFTEIARELSKEDSESAGQIRLLVLDEPTAVLSEKEADTLLVAMKKLSKEGISIIFISHRLQEIIDVCDQIMVMRDGRIIKQVPNDESVNISEIAQWMVGREVSIDSGSGRTYDYSNARITLSIRNLWVDMPGETVRDVNLDVYRGEILGIGGLAGQGKLGIPNGVMGLYNGGGTVEFEGKRLPLNNPRKLLDAGLAFVSEDRRGVGLLLDESLEWNISFTAMQVEDKYLTRKLGFIKWRDEGAIKAETKKYVDKLAIKCTSTKQKAKELSGGNQQKVCLAKAFAVAPKLLFVAEPTRGIDIGAKALVLQALKEYNQQQGTTIVMISSELEELRSICDRIAIVTDGKVHGILPASSPRADFGLLMVGQGKKVANA